MGLLISRVVADLRKYVSIQGERMILGFILTTIIAVCCWLSSSDRVSSRWAGLAFFTAGAGFLTVPTGYSQVDHLLAFVEDAGQYASIFLFPYCYLMFGLHYCDWLRTRQRTALCYSLFCIPALLPLLHDRFADDLFVLLWVAPYLLTASALLIRAYMLELSPARRRNKALVALFFVPLTTIDLFTGYVMDVLQLEGAIQLNYMLAVTSFILFFSVLIRYGMLGIRLRIERQQIELSREVFSLGSLKLFHALKNQIGNINLQGHLIRRLAEETHDAALERRAAMILSNTSQMQHMMERIELQSNDIIVTLSEHAIVPLLRKVIDSFELETQGIGVETEFACQAVIKCDAVHLEEVFTNLIRNAIDAMNDRAAGDNRPNRLQIGLYETKEGITIYVQDNGRGIAKADLPKVLQPFYTTKRRASGNFGLGLTYCDMVLSKHQGSLEIKSKENQGTEVLIHLKRQQIVRYIRNGEGADTDERH